MLILLAQQFCSKQNKTAHKKGKEISGTKKPTEMQLNPACHSAGILSEKRWFWNFHYLIA